MDSAAAREQAKQAEKRLAVDSAVSGLTLLSSADGASYRPKGVVAGAVAALVHLDHPIIAMRALSACWTDEAIDVPSATWVISEVFESDSAQAKHEAAALLDAHAGELCGDSPGVFSWPAAMEYHWPATAPLPAQIRLVRAVLRTLVSRDRRWWIDGGRQGWAAGLLYDALLSDTDDAIQLSAARALDILIPCLREAGLVQIQAEAWIDVGELAAKTDAMLRRHRHDADAPSSPVIAMLMKDQESLEAWARNGGT
jgi:hypothetical protein